MAANRVSAVVLKLIKELKNKGSLCGETHVQKTMYFLQEIEGVNSGFDFMIYKHGPYSFDLRDTLASLRANGIIVLVPQRYPFGPSVALTETGEALLREYSVQLEADVPKIEHIARVLGEKEVVDLERLGTALYVSKTNGIGSDFESLANEITRLKPHISRERAMDALKQVNEVNPVP